MGRAKLKLGLIEREKPRLLTLKKRKEGLMKKLHELTTLCGISACMIIYDSAASPPSIWPRNSDEEVRRLIDSYLSKREDFCVKNYGVSDFFSEKQKEIEGELEKLRKKNLEAKYPSWDERLCLMDQSQLRGFSAALRNKILNARSRIQLLKQESEFMMMRAPFYDAMAHNNFNHYYDYDQEIKASDVMQRNFAAQFPVNMQSLYAAAPPQPYAVYYQPHPVMIDQSGGCFYSSMDQNMINWGC